MNPRRLLLLAFLAALTLTAALARPAVEGTQTREARWFEAQSPHFLLFTDTSETKAWRLLEDFEGRFAALDRVIGPLPDRQFSIEIFLFDKGDDFTEAAGAEPEKSAYLFHGPDRIFIASRDKSPEDVANDAGHALGHALFERNALWRPFWLAEGAAEYFRKAGRKPDLKTISKAEGFSAREILRVVPHNGYLDSDPPSAFRTQAHRLLRATFERHPEALRSLLRAIRSEAGENARPDIDNAELTRTFDKYTETAIPLEPRADGIRIGPANPLRLAIHRGDLLVAASRPDPAEKRYESVSGSPEARAARAIFTRFSRNSAEASRVLDRAAREFPDNPVVQFHFGSVEIASPRELLDAQTAGLERAVKSLPLLGQAYAELGRLYTLTGRPGASLPLIDEALKLEPEYGYRFYEIRAPETLAALHRLDEARASLKIAYALPHSTGRSDAIHEQRIKALESQVENLRHEVESRKVERLIEEVNRVADLNDTPPPKAAVPAALRRGSMEYTMDVGVAVAVRNVVYPDFPQALLETGKGADIVFDVLIGTDGRVARIAPLRSDAPFLNVATASALSRWTFTGQTAPFTAKLTFRYIVDEERPR